MLSSMLKDHQQKQIKKRDEIDAKRNDAIKSATQLTSSLVNHLNDGVARAYLNQRKLDSEAKQLVSNVTQFSRSVSQWLLLMDNLNKSLKQLGDVTNWSKSIEADMRLVSSALEYVYKVGPHDQQQQK